MTRAKERRCVLCGGWRGEWASDVDTVECDECRQAKRIAIAIRAMSVEEAPPPRDPDAPTTGTGTPGPIRAWWKRLMTRG